MCTYYPECSALHKRHFYLCRECVWRGWTQRRRDALPRQGLPRGAVQHGQQEDGQEPGADRPPPWSHTPEKLNCELIVKPEEVQLIDWEFDV